MRKPHNSIAQGTFFFTGADGARRAVSADGYDLLYHFPRALRGDVLVSLSRSLPCTQLTWNLGGSRPRGSQMGSGSSHHRHVQERFH